MPEHFTDGGDPMAALDLDLTRAAEREQRELEAAQNKPNYDGGIDWIWRLTPEERVTHMRERRFSLRQLAAWSARCPDEVPKLPYLGGMEFEWIVVNTPEWCEAAEDNAAARDRAVVADNARAPRKPSDPDKWAAIRSRWREQAANSTWE
jgi:hypothetical protein